MALADYEPARVRIELPGGNHFNVRGLSVADIGSILRLHLEDMEVVREIVLDQVRGELTTGSAINVGFDFIQKCPSLAATVIAVAADELEHAPKVLALPVYVQFAALKTIAVLSFEDIAGLKRMVAMAVNAVREALPLAEPSLT